VERPRLRVADVLKRHWPEFVRRHPVESHVRKVMGHLRDCRTAALGGRLQCCDGCGTQVPVYNSCRDRHCPTCQTLRKQRWLEQRRAELLPVPYFHVVFTLPHALHPLALANRTRLLRELFGTVNWVLQHFAADPQWKLCGQLGFIAVLHTWTQRLTLHDHVHCLVPGGAWNADAGTWRSANRNYLFGKSALCKAFQARYIRRLQTLRRSGRLRFDGPATPLATDAAWNGLIQALWTTPWIVYPKATARRPERTLDYLGRYTHRVAIGDHRIRALDRESVTFDWRDRAARNTLKQMTLSAEEFIGRFMLHVLPHGFAKVRAFGWLAGRHKTATLTAIRRLLKAPPSPPPSVGETAVARILRLTGVDVTLCPRCKAGHLVQVAMIHPTRDGPA
jgi:hypothetical protein